MKHFYLFLTSGLLLCSSCHKEDLIQSSVLNKPDEIKQTTPTSAAIYNPIVGKWELGSFKVLCPGATDTTIYPNEKGDFVEFLKTDTAFYTYNTTNATGWSPYKIVDATRFILGDTMHIVSNDGLRLTTYSRSPNGGTQQWMTYKKVATK